MKIIETRQAPNPRRVRIFLAEKGLEIPREEIDLLDGGAKTENFTRLNPMQSVPVLLLDDGFALAETIAICRYVEEALQPEPNLMGRSPRALFDAFLADGGIDDVRLGALFDELNDQITGSRP